MYAVNIKCDQCDKEDIVPQVGASPVGWIAIQYAGPNISLDNRQESQVERKTFCSWTCLVTFSSGFTVKLDG